MFFGRFGGSDPIFFIQSAIKSNVEPMFKVLKTTFLKKNKKDIYETRLLEKQYQLP